MGREGSQGLPTGDCGGSGASRWPQGYPVTVRTLLGPSGGMEVIPNSPMIRIDREPLEPEQTPLARFVRANCLDDEAMNAVARLVTGTALECAIGGGAGPLATLSLVFVY